MQQQKESQMKMWVKHLVLKEEFDILGKSLFFFLSKFVEKIDTTLLSLW